MKQEDAFFLTVGPLFRAVSNPKPANPEPQTLGLKACEIKDEL